MATTRDPYPYPQYQNDNDFMGASATKRDPFGLPTHLAQARDPWRRLYNKYTLSSSRHEVTHFDPQAPRDSLDFILKAGYNHHSEFLKDGNETLVQPETLGSGHNRILKNKTFQVPPDPFPMNHPLRTAKSERKEDINSIKNVIPSHHNQRSNPGFVRKHDGGLYTV
ncbi:hypothetical protein CAPTEDRAFT_21746 [Capitella teleta]|uniref:Uncharacterized protein n=1 Tax=Capitella teleta TaxID=283909 RepID=R7T4M1_CAPTE|nr:hypothetical protein CAPTEDRAFT_21746 [Capitella teleta]|eukprot:ELT87776.1 hypothetical protein CAPTEDRAFT_21746 [Capitella teleta]